LAVDLYDNEMKVSYSLNNGQSINFWVPGRNQNFRWAAHSVRESHLLCVLGLTSPSAMDSPLVSIKTCSGLPAFSRVMTQCGWTFSIDTASNPITRLSEEVINYIVTRKVSMI
jgi:hypothetical protein